MVKTSRGSDSCTYTEDQMEDNTNGAAGDRLGGIENLTGSAQADVLTGDADVANVLKGGGGNDTLSGGSDGNDTLDGGAGDDTLNGGNETGNDADDNPNGDTLKGGAGDDTLTAVMALTPLTAVPVMTTCSVADNGR